MGVPEEDLAPIKTWSDRLAAYLGGAVDERDNFAEARAGIEALVDYFHRLIAERERCPADDLTSLMLRAEHEGERLTRDEVIANCVLLLFAGHETTTNLLGNGLFHLLRHPEPGGPRACRAVAPPRRRRGASALRRSRARHGEDRDRGRSVHGGRSPRRHGHSLHGVGQPRSPQFRDPDTLDVRRQPERHVAFRSRHPLLPRRLARALEARIVLDTVFRRLPGLALATTASRWKPMIFLRGLERCRSRGEPMKAAVMRAIGAPRAIEEIHIDRPGPREVRPHGRDRRLSQRSPRSRGSLVNPLPTVLGHEPAGVVEAVGPRCATSRPATT